MRVDDSAGPLSEIADRPQQRPSAAWREPRRKAVTQSAARGAVPTRTEVHALLQRKIG